MSAGNRTALGRDLEAALREVRAFRRDEKALPVREIAPIPAERIRALRMRVARSLRDFERRFGVPARTLEGWEQGRRVPDVAARILLRVIERDPKAVERALITSGDD